MPQKCLPMKRVCGLDIHKDSIFCCISDENGVVFQEKFGVLTSELLRLVSCLQEFYTSEVAMESTSIYWMPIWRILDQYFPQKLVNPCFIRQLPDKVKPVNPVFGLFILRAHLFFLLALRNAIIFMVFLYFRKVFCTFVLK